MERLWCRPGLRAAGAAIACVFAAGLSAKSPKTHRLEATPETVAYRILLGRRETRFAHRVGRHHRRRHVADEFAHRSATCRGLHAKIQASLKSIVASVTGDRRGPGGHILTGPVYVEGAAPGDALEVRILAIDFPIDYGYNGCSGVLPDNCDRSASAKIVPLIDEVDDGRIRAGHRHPAAAVLRQHRRRARAGSRRRQQQSTRPPRRESRQQGAWPWQPLYIPVFAPGPSSNRRRPRRTGGRRSRHTALETSLIGPRPADRPQRHEPDVAPRRDPDPFHHHGRRSRFDNRDENSDPGDGRFHRQRPAVCHLTVPISWSVSRETSPSRSSSTNPMSGFTSGCPSRSSSETRGTDAAVY